MGLVIGIVVGYAVGEIAYLALFLPFGAEWASILGYTVGALPGVVALLCFDYLFTLHRARQSYPRVLECPKCKTAAVRWRFAPELTPLGSLYNGLPPAEYACTGCSNRFITRR